MAHSLDNNTSLFTEDQEVIELPDVEKEEDEMRLRGIEVYTYVDFSGTNFEENIRFEDSKVREDVILEDIRTDRLEMSNFEVGGSVRADGAEIGTLILDDIRDYDWSLDPDTRIDDIVTRSVYTGDAFHGYEEEFQKNYEVLGRDVDYRIPKLTSSYYSG